MERPLVGIVSRFTRQKGADLVAEAAGELAARGFYVAALGEVGVDLCFAFQRRRIDLHFSLSSRFSGEAQPEDPEVGAIK